MAASSVQSATESGSEVSDNELVEEPSAADTSENVINPGDSGIEYGAGTSSNVESDSDSESGYSEDDASTTRTRIKVGRGRTKVVNVDMRPPDKLLRKAMDKAVRMKNRKKNSEALEEYIRAMALSRIVYGDGHWRVAESYLNLARAYLELRGLGEQARQHAETARNLLLKTDQNDPDKSSIQSCLIHTYCILGRALTKLKKYEEAENALFKADKLTRERNRSAVVDPSSTALIDLSIASALGRLASCQNKFDVALTCYEQVLDLSQRQYGDDSDNLIQAYIDVGIAEQQAALDKDSTSGSHDKAIESFLQAHSIASVNHPGCSLQTARTAETLAQGYVATGKGEDSERSAESYFREALDIFTQLCGENHPSTIKVLEQLAMLNIRLKNYPDAVELTKQALEAKKESSGEVSETVAESYKTLGTIYLTQGDMPEAHANLKKAFNMTAEIHGSNNKRTKEIQKTLNIVAQSPQLKERQRTEKSLENRPNFSAVFKKK